ncbi:hypothetical protein V6C53_09890 [Desulfocurvibacter africanus]|uniref:hypothetical protein n=1 Tax=Desulfocurvibacter africanus TaxID=873 RepID=UPI002FD94CC9
MLIADKKHFTLGLFMAIVFAGIMFTMFMPLFEHGENAFQASDRLFNRISKDSSYYMPEMFKAAESQQGTNVDVSFTLGGENLNQYAKTLLTTSGMSVQDIDGKMQVQGDLGQMMTSSLRDADAMFFNKGDEVQARYGIPERSAMYTWWLIYGAMDKDLKLQSNFAPAAVLGKVKNKGIEVAYNYYGIKPISAASNWGILTFSLVFYVAYTLWWGYAIFFLCEGMGLVMKKGAKKEA